MTKIKQLNEELQEIEGLRNLVNAYEEIASIRMKKTRDSVLQTREFLSEIKNVFEEVRVSYAKEAKMLARRRGIGASEKITFLAHNGKTVSVLLSSNTGLYGNIVKGVYDIFVGEVKQINSEVTIIGRHGLNLFLSENLKKPYTFFEMPDYGITSGVLIDVIKHIVQYEEIHVFYGEYVNVIKQNPTMFTISAEINLSEGINKKARSYIFEPSLESILRFFETQIFASLFEQAVRESELAKYASRFLAMDSAIGNINKLVKLLEYKKMSASHKLSNRKQLNMMNCLFAGQFG